MAGSLTDVWEKKVLDLIFRNADASATVPMGLDATNMWVALFTVAPSDSTAGTEVTGGSYARVAVARSTGFGTAAGASPAMTSNVATVTMPLATADWGTVVAFGLCKSAAGALATDLVYWGDLAASKTIANGDNVYFAAGSLLLTLD